MSNILIFPEAQVRRWTQIEASIRRALVGGGAEKECVDYVCERLRKSFDEIADELEIQVPECAADLVGQMNAFHHDNCARLLLRLAFAYIECYRALGSIT